MFSFFPGNYMWSQAVLRAIWAGGSIGEVTKVVQGLQGAAEDYDYDAWHRAWRALGDHVWDQAEREQAAGHVRSAGESFLRACGYYQ
jgi:hypothetical protein